MHPHFCGNWLHDLVHNSIVFLSMAPDWLPLVRTWAATRLAKRHRH